MRGRMVVLLSSEAASVPQAAYNAHQVAVIFIARSAATKQSTVTMPRRGLLRGACHRAALWADPLARNDGSLLDSRRPDHLQVGRGLALEETVHLSRRHRQRFDAESCQIVLHRRLIQHLHPGGMESLDDVARRFRGREDAEPDRALGIFQSYLRS